MRNIRPRRASVTSPSNSTLSPFSSLIVTPSVEGGAAAERAAAYTHELRDRSHVGRLGTLRAFALLERDPCALGERLEAVAGDVAVVHEQVLRAFIGRDEAVKLAVVEPLDGSVCHEKNTSHTSSRRGEEGAGTQTDLALIPH